jgi:nicotinamidase-related amidase
VNNTLTKNLWETLELPANPFTYTFSPAHTALVIIDMQRDFLERGGFGESLGNDVTRLQAIVPALQKVLETWRNHGLTVIHTREVHKADLSDCPPAKLNLGKPSLRIGDVGPMGRILIDGEASSEIIPELLPLANELVINKPGKGAFYNTSLEKQLQAREIRSLIVTGVTTEVCVQTTMREANDRGFECLLLEDCTESYFPEFKRVTLEMIRAQGAIVGWTATSDALLTTLENRSYDAVFTD